MGAATEETAARMRALLVNPAFPETYWSLKHMLPLVRRKWLVAPLGLITVAALLPGSWDFELIDLEVEPLTDEALAGCDVVMLTGMLVQRTSLRAILRKCRALGVRTVVGGPYAAAMPDELEDADHLVLGEGEQVIPELGRDLAAGKARRIYRPERRPELSTSPIPRFDLLRKDVYLYLAVQASRGCPFRCEFCDIISLYGRRPRTKPPAQVLAELDAILATGFRGRVMFVDDNFIGDKKAALGLAEVLEDWRRHTRAPLDFFTEASINLADDPELVDAMVAAGFAVVFVGVETPVEESLAETRKTQNLGRDMVQQIRSLRARGLDVWGGFILGFDNDGPDVFDRMIDFVQRSGIAYATVGMLIALPGTPLYERLAREGRLRPNLETGDMLSFSNVVTRLPKDTLLEGYIRVVETLYDPEIYFARCREHLEHWESNAAARLEPSGLSDLPVVWRSLWAQGLRGRYRTAYWRFLAWVAARHPRKLPMAIAQACAGHHFITYTRESVAPDLRRHLAASEEIAPGFLPDEASERAIDALSS